MKCIIFHLRTNNESEINAWLDANPNIHVDFITQSRSGSSYGDVMVIVWYHSVGNRGIRR